MEMKPPLRTLEELKALEARYIRDREIGLLTLDQLNHLLYRIDRKVALLHP